MQAACTARDSAEKAWRGAKDPAPAAVRLARAQAKLDRAIDIQSESRQALAEYEEAHRQMLATLQARLEEDRARVRLRRQQLEAVQEEVGAEGLGARTRAKQSEAARQVHSALCGTVAPTIAALVEQLDSATPAWSVLNGLLGTLSQTKSTLEEAFNAAPGTQRYNIADGAGADAEEDEWEEDWEGASQWSESHDIHAEAPAARSSAWGAAAAASDTHVAATPTGPTGDRDADQGDQCMGTGEWWDSSSQAWGPGARWQACGHGKWARASWADSWEGEQEGQGSTVEQPAAARRRLEDAPARGLCCEGAAGDQEQADVEERKRQYERRVQHIVTAAIDAGIQPLTADGEELQVLDPRRLDEWVATYFPEGVPAR